MCIPSTTRCTSLSSLLFILIFIKSHIMFLHIQFVLHTTVLLFCTFLYSIAHFTSYFFLPIYIYILLCGVTLYNLILILFLFYFYFILFYFYSLHCPLSGPDLTYISLLIIPCIIYHVTNKETLNLEMGGPGLSRGGPEYMGVPKSRLGFPITLSLSALRRLLRLT